MLSDRQLDDLLAVFDRRMWEINDQYLRTVGAHLKRLGTMTASDINRVIEMARLGASVNDIQRSIVRALKLSQQDVNTVFMAVADADARFMYEVMGHRYSGNIADNEALRRLVEAQARVTHGAMQNLSQTTVVSTAYRNAVDTAVQAVQMHVSDYRSVIRGSIRDVAENGLQVVQYQSGTKRRLDTAVRQNVLDGVRALNRAMADQIGEELGADGVEISAHMLCATDHLPYQGKQYSMAEFRAFQDDPGREPRRKIGMWNCKHWWTPIVLGQTKPLYDDDTLHEYERYSDERFTIFGKTLGRYQWTQEMRKIETQIRREKEKRIIADASDVPAESKAATASISALQARYKRICAVTGLEPQWGRTRLGGQ